jgi:hypothetical protein
MENREKITSGFQPPPVMAQFANDPEIATFKLTKSVDPKDLNVWNGVVTWVEDFKSPTVIFSIIGKFTRFLLYIFPRYIQFVKVTSTVALTVTVNFIITVTFYFKGILFFYQLG